MSFTILQQYIKKLQFERKNYIRKEVQPNISIQLELENHYNQKFPSELILHFTIQSTVEKTTIFSMNLSYACIFQIDSSSESEEKDINEIFLSDIPNLMFPFVRHIIAYITQDAGFPPLILQGINFNDFFESIKDKNYYGLKQ